MSRFLKRHRPESLHFWKRSNPAENIESLPLTFGVEFEFILVTKGVILKSYDQIAEVLEHFGCPTIADTDISPTKKAGRNSFKSWRVTYDISLAPTGRDVIPKHVKDDLETFQFDKVGHGTKREDAEGVFHVSSPDTEETTAGMAAREGLEDLDPELWPERERQKWWFPIGVELISRILPAPASEMSHPSAHASLTEIEKYLKVLNLGNENPALKYSTYVNETCGFHVHVGLSPDLKGARIPLGLVQHLAYIVVQFEPIISSLFPMDRRGLEGHKSSWIIGSNLMGIRRSRHICSKASLPELAEVEELIFSRNMTVKKLAILMGADVKTPGATFSHVNSTGKFKFVNFSNLIDSEKDSTVPLTIEFRQHEGTLDFVDTCMWIMFVLKLVRAAEKKMIQSKPASPLTPEELRSPTRMLRELDLHMSLPSPRRQGNKYKVKCQTQFEEMNRLFKLIELNDDEKDYWLGSYAALNPDDVVERSEKELICSPTEAQCEVCMDEKHGWRRTRMASVGYSRQRRVPRPDSESKGEGQTACSVVERDGSCQR